MKCPKCGNRIRSGETVCRFCRAELTGKNKKKPKKEKADKLGNCAIVFAFFIPVIGLVLGILALVKASKNDDMLLRRDGIKAIIMSVVVLAVMILFGIVLLMVISALPFIIPSM